MKPIRVFTRCIGRFRIACYTSSSAVLAGEEKFREVAVDRSDLKNIWPEEAKPQTANMFCKEEMTPLAKEIISLIKAKGPLSVHDFVTQALNHPVHGYYQRSEDKIGSTGDFVTAPEISQLFGEMIGIWCISVWQHLKCPDKFNLIELGPGNGTLMKDIVRVASKFPGFRSAASIHLVELSRSLRIAQSNQLTIGGLSEIEEAKRYSGTSGIPVHWHSFLQQVPSEDPCIIVGQEFLDAFPTHQFQYTAKGWREKLIDISTDGDTPHHFKMTLSKGKTPATIALLEGKFQELQGEKLEIKLPDELKNSPAAKALKEELAKQSKEFAISAAHTARREFAMQALKVGDCIEICPLALATCEDIAKRVAKGKGAAILVDYGENFTQEDTLRAFQKHKQVHVLSQPGYVDITSDVDFSMCARIAARRGAVVLPLQTQQEFLMKMGVVDRVERLINSPQTTEEQGAEIIEALKKLVDPAIMGKKFKVMMMVHPDLGDSEIAKLFS